MIIIGRNWLGDVKRYEADSIAAVLTAVYGPVTNTGYTADDDGRVSWGVYGNLGYVTGSWGDYVATYRTVVDGRFVVEVLLSITMPDHSADAMPIDAADQFPTNLPHCHPCGLAFPSLSAMESHHAEAHARSVRPGYDVSLDDALRAIEQRDPDGGEFEPTTSDYAEHKWWAVATYGAATWARYFEGGWGHQPGDDPRHVEY